MAQLETNTQELREILETVNALPTAGAGSTNWDMELSFRFLSMASPSAYEGVEYSIISGNASELWDKVSRNEEVNVVLYCDYYYSEQPYHAIARSVATQAATLRVGKQFIADFTLECFYVSLSFSIDMDNNIVYVRV